MRLIDADKLLRFFTIDTANQTYRFGTIKKQIENAETVQAIIIPKGATNGDMIKAMFPNCKIMLDNEGLLGLRPAGENWIIWFTQSWWNAPYKRGDSLVNGEDKKLDDSPFVEIGMCKDCKRYNRNEMFCTWHGGYLMQKCDPDFYCADFERRE